eukprot:3201676-Pyramimonas_sp.AAC.1
MREGATNQTRKCERTEEGGTGQNEQDDRLVAKYSDIERALGANANWKDERATDGRTHKR